jgi:cold shock CspA family protein
MRIDGKLAKWNDERGFGFIAPLQGGSEIFVHISAFPKDTPRPQPGELLSFEIAAGKDGKKRAVNARRPPRASARPARTERSASRRRSQGWRWISVAPVLLIALGVYGYAEHSNRFSVRMTVPSGVSREPGEVAIPPAPSRIWQCDGRAHCSEMTSCAEAKFFLKNCPGVKMDGDGDGVPCEDRWCTSPFAR